LTVKIIANKLVFLLAYLVTKNISFISNRQHLCILHLYTLEDLKWDKFNNVAPINIELDTINVKPFIIINSRGIFLFSKNDLFINPNDIDIK